MEIKKDLSPNFTKATDSMKQYQVPRTVDSIVLHWWGDPASKPTLQGTVNWLKNPASKVSAHYVISDKTIIQLVEEANIAWHARQANPITIGIEIDPTFKGDTYNTVAWLVKDICDRRNLAVNTVTVKGHNAFVATACPGTLDINRVISLANEASPTLNLMDDIPSIIEDKYELKTHAWYDKYWSLHEFIKDSIKIHAKYDILDTKYKDLEKKNKSQDGVISSQIEQIKEKNTQVETLQKSNSENTAQLLLMSRQVSTAIEERKLAQDKLQELKIDKELADLLNTNMSIKLAGLENKITMGLKGYSKGELFRAWLFGV